MPKPFKSSAREIVLKVRAFCEREKANQAPLIRLDQVRARVAAMTGMSEKTVSRITKEGEVAVSTSQKLKSPGKHRQKRKTVDLDDFDLCALRNKIHEMYTVRKVVPTLNKLLIELRNDINFGGGRTTLWKILKRIGFQYKKCGSKRNILMERHDIVAWRRKYIDTMRINRVEGRPIVFLDETYIHASYAVQKCWQKGDEDGVLTRYSPGTRWIIVNAGGEMGFISNAQSIFKSQSKSGDYHDDMNRTNFMKWLSEKLIPNLPPNSLVVMDNAPYQIQVNKASTMSSSKLQMQEWITNKELSYLPTMLKAELYQIIKEHKEAPIYEADQLLISHGYKLVRLPPLSL
ncbi:uncharacterized protein LOC114247384 [Bombyx mandarina]|nr:uncharacterized protein LOC114247384 [Bombyx mandarina]